jgi:predicted nucleotidyltransferase component of viral defense system
MSIEIIKQKVDQYDPQTEQDKENAYKEIMQEVLLLSLSRAGFFKEAAFHGGTALRILFGLDRFSEDLDFVLFKPDSGFEIGKYLNSMRDELSIYGFDLEIQDKSKIDNTIQKVFIKDSSVGKILQIHGFFGQPNPRKIKIKIEIDTNPPSGSEFETQLLTFPSPFDVVAQDLPSLFASKSHALLCRSYLKGRDWYDFIWYSNRSILINYSLLTSAIDQNGPWAGKKVVVTKDWYVNAIKEKIGSVNWDAAKRDVQRFLRPGQQKSLEFWSSELFLACLKKIS